MTRKFIVKPRFFYGSYGVDYHIEEVENAEQIGEKISEQREKQKN
jgi:hypothetical protein